MSIKHYVYVSDTRVEMLFSRIPKTFLTKLGGDLTGTFRLGNSNCKRQAERPRIYTKLEAVIRYLAETRNVGTIEEPHTYFKGTFPMTWGPFGGQSGEVATPFVYFACRTPYTLFGLGGSWHHVTCGQQGQSTTHCRPEISAVCHALSAELEHPRPKKSERKRRSRSSRRKLKLSVALATYKMRGIQGDLEFFAKKLAFFPQPKPEVETERRPLSILLGTPLYVALIQRDDERTH